MGTSTRTRSMASADQAAGAATLRPGGTMRANTPCQVRAPSDADIMSFAEVAAAVPQEPGVIQCRAVASAKPRSIAPANGFASDQSVEPATLRCSTISWCRSAAFSASSRLFDLNGEVSRVRRKQSSAIIADEFGRFGHAIDTHEVFGTHSPPSSIMRRASA